MDGHDEFSLDPGIIYLNHAAVAPWPRRTVDAVCAFAEENLRYGSRNYPRWVQTELQLRERLARLINVGSAADIGLLKSTSEGLSVIAYGLDWQPGDNVVSAREEFPSNRLPWDSLRARGVALRLADLSGPDSPEDALLALTDHRTRLVSISAVQYASGLRMDLERLGAECRARGILFCVDAIQAIGAVCFDAQAVSADFVVADGHKWMLGPEGLAVFYVRPELRERLRLHQYGWHMVEAAGDFDRDDWAPAASARRFECGSPNMLGIHGLNASLSLLEELGMDMVERTVINNVQYLIENLERIDEISICSPVTPGRFAGIVAFRPRHSHPEGLFQALQQAGIQCALRGGCVRFSPHFHTSDSQLDAALDRVRAYVVD
ncbi:MAG: class V aminotransferase [Chromatiales bacterium 21-64-14]|nr:MAG: class V aminotransferase [Chromatiales bacterium 21-64-14]HQU17269.1 aminotransferase class V-fold PLP-dependent enzyme [Gammaproteobacteria bacterium]